MRSFGRCELIRGNRNGQRLLQSVTALLTTAVAGVAGAQTLSIAAHVPQTHLASARAAEPFMECVTQKSDGRISFDFFGGGQIGNHQQSLAIVTDGVVDISYVSVSSLTDKMPLNNIPMLPGLGTTAVQMTKAMRMVLDSHGVYDAEYAATDVVPLLINMYPPYQIMSVDDKLESMTEMSNKKIRSSGGAHTFTVSALGAVPVEISAGDTYIALQQETIDGAILPVASVTQYALEEVIKSISSNLSLGTALGVYAIDRSTYEALPATDQEILQDCGRRVEMELAHWIDESTQSTLEELTLSGIDVYDISPSELEKINVSLSGMRQQVVARMTERGLESEDAYKEYNAALSAASN